MATCYVPLCRNSTDEAQIAYVRGYENITLMSLQRTYDDGE